MKKIIVLLPIYFLFLILCFSCSFKKDLIQNIHSKAETASEVADELFYDVIYYSIEFFLLNDKWPEVKEDLIKQAANDDYQINFNHYKSFYIEQSLKNRINIHFVINTNEIQSGKNIKGIIGIYVSDKNKINIKNYPDKRIICSFTIGKNPYSTNISENYLSIDRGYDLHVYIEQNDRRISNEGCLIINNYPMTRYKEKNKDKKLKN